MLKTEMRNPKTTHIDKMSPLEIAKVMNEENAYCVQAVEAELPQIAKAIDAIAEALQNGGADISKMVAQYDARRRIMVDGFRKIGLDCFEPKGAFYAFPCIKSSGLTSSDFCEKLLYSKKVALVPGNAFGESGEGFVRVSYAYSLKHLMQALECIERFVKRHAYGE